MTRKNLKIFCFVCIQLLNGHPEINAQPPLSLRPEKIISDFIQNIGGEKWNALISRKEHAFVEYQAEKNSIIQSKSYDRILVNLQPGMSIEVHTQFGSQRSVLAFKPYCNWYYSNRSQTLKFFGPELVKFNNTFPRTELLEVLNLKMIENVSIEDTLYRIDFKDKRQLDGKQSMFFGKRSALLYKRSYISKNAVKWEFHFDNYRESHGFYEPYDIRLTSNGVDFFTIAIKRIEYNIKIDPAVFNPPIACRNEDDFIRLDFPYSIEIK